jgi:hypothetical protein
VLTLSCTLFVFKLFQMSDQQFFQDGYQQALDDFGIRQLLSKLSTYSDADFEAGLMHLEEQEMESLAAILIGQLTKTLNGKLIASCLNAIRHANLDPSQYFIQLEFPPTVDLRPSFPDRAPVPRFLYGDKLRLVHLGSQIESGMVIGHFYKQFAHCSHWMWCYILLLDQASCSATGRVAITASDKDVEADPRYADLKEVDLSKAELPFADLGGADLRQANLVGANLDKDGTLDANLEGATYSEATVLPPTQRWQQQSLILGNPPLEPDNKEVLVDLESLKDERERTNVERVSRKDQRNFRDSLLVAFQGKCAITSCDVERALDAAHIFPYRGKKTDCLWNGILLRLDIHRLFDSYLLTIDHDSGKVYLESSLINSYEGVANNKVCFPEEPVSENRKQALRWHNAQCSWLRSE